MSARNISIKRLVTIDIGAELLITLSGVGTEGTAKEKIRVVTINGKSMGRTEKTKQLLELLHNEIDAALSRPVEIAPEDFGPALPDEKPTVAKPAAVTAAAKPAVKKA